MAHTRSFDPQNARFLPVSPTMRSFLDVEAARQPGDGLEYGYLPMMTGTGKRTYGDYNAFPDWGYGAGELHHSCPPDPF